MSASLNGATIWKTKFKSAACIYTDFRNIKDEYKDRFGKIITPKEIVTIQRSFQ
jgi:hypothetical protein